MDEDGRRYGFCCLHNSRLLVSILLVCEKWIA